MWSVPVQSIECGGYHLTEYIKNSGLLMDYMITTEIASGLGRDNAGKIGVNYYLILVFMIY